MPGTFARCWEFAIPPQFPFSPCSQRSCRTAYFPHLFWLLPLIYKVLFLLAVVTATGTTNRFFASVRSIFLLCWVGVWIWFMLMVFWIGYAGFMPDLKILSLDFRQIIRC